jgi:hypothetical protein
MLNFQIVFMYKVKWKLCVWFNQWNMFFLFFTITDKCTINIVKVYIYHNSVSLYNLNSYFSAVFEQVYVI